MSDLEFAALIFWFTAYYFIERCLRFILNVCHKPFYEKIRASRKDLVFFGIWMGLIISAFSAPSCAYGARTAWARWRISQSGDWSLDPSSKVCVASRAILWTSELNRLDLYNLYVVHHAASIVSLLSFIYFQWPTVILFTLYSTLFSEIPGDMVWMLSSYLDASERASPALVRFKRNLIYFNTLQYTLVRGAGIISVFWMLLKNSPGIQGRSILEQVYGYTLLGLYTLFCGSYVFRQYHSISTSMATEEKREDAFQKRSQTTRLFPKIECTCSGTIEIRFDTYPTIFFVPYGLFMGIGLAALVFLSLAIGALSNEDIERLSFALNICLVSAVVFARLLSVIMEDGIARIVSQPLHALFRPGFWLHGGFFGAGVGALIGFRLGYIKAFSVFAGSLSIGLPLYETFSRIGCHTYGCCYGQVAQPQQCVASPDRIPLPLLWRVFPYPAVRYDHATRYAATRINPELLNKPLTPIQLISATLFLLIFLCVSIPLLHYTSVEAAASTTLIFHAIVRLITEPHRADYRGEKRYNLSATGRMAIVQMTCAILWLAKALASEGGMHVSLSKLGGNRSSIGELVQRSTFAVILGTVVYGIHIGEVGSWTGRGQ